MPNQNHNYQTRLQAIATGPLFDSLPEIKHGVEREALRVAPDGGLAKTSHPTALGATLTHGAITTDFSEALLEFITPPETQPSVTLAQLADIHKFVQAHIGEEQLWPMSMPCFVSAETAIPIARYGSSNVGKMKEVYRQGLHNRYGSMMQVIAGVHFNFSLSDTFWQHWCVQHEMAHNKENVSSFYFDMIRNFQQLSWLVPYLYGASPALCQSFLAGKEHQLPFEKLGRGTLYLPYATSLRMSDLGYTNAEQSALNICYNDLSSYVNSVRKAINTESSAYAKYKSGEQGQWQQLNKNVLQIENELYSPIRPKQITKSLEKPSDALQDRGVSYIEVRALDVDPFSPLGINEGQFYFLDVFLLYCLLQESDKFSTQSYSENHNNLTSVVMEGRKPDLQLTRNAQAISLQDWCSELFTHFTEIADILDRANKTSRYSEAVAEEYKKVLDPTLTPSGQWLAKLQSENIDNSLLGLSLSKAYKAHADDLQYSHFDHDWFVGRAKQSILEQQQVEAADSQDFASFINDYFSK